MISNPRSFHEEGRRQLACAVCGATGSFQVHHVVSKQDLKRRGLGGRLYDPRNALRLCEGLDGARCHMNREHGGVNKVTIFTKHLTDDNICFIWEVLNVAGQNYLERHYTGLDRRYTLHTRGRCQACQSKAHPSLIA